MEEFNGFKYYDGMFDSVVFPFLQTNNLTMFTVKRVLNSQGDILPGNVFRSIKVGKEDEGGGMYPFRGLAV